VDPRQQLSALRRECTLLLSSPYGMDPQRVLDVIDILERELAAALDVGYSEGFQAGLSLHPQERERIRRRQRPLRLTAIEEARKVAKTRHVDLDPGVKSLNLKYPTQKLRRDPAISAAQERVRDQFYVPNDTIEFDDETLDQLLEEGQELRQKVEDELRESRRMDNELHKRCR